MNNPGDSRLLCWWDRVLRRRWQLVFVVAAMLNRGLWLIYREIDATRYVSPVPVRLSFLVCGVLLAGFLIGPKQPTPTARTIAAVLAAGPYLAHVFSALAHFNWSWVAWGGPATDLLLIPILVASWGTTEHPATAAERMR